METISEEVHAIAGNGHFKTARSRLHPPIDRAHTENINRTCAILQTRPRPDVLNLNRAEFQNSHNLFAQGPTTLRKFHWRKQLMDHSEVSSKKTLHQLAGTGRGELTHLALPSHIILCRQTGKKLSSLVLHSTSDRSAKLLYMIFKDVQSVMTTAMVFHAVASILYLWHQTCGQFLEPSNPQSKWPL